jgi:NAD(P)-dependent dehydrogenase (short-subunit alcohol dehydrogenase family)
MNIVFHLGHIVAIGSNCGLFGLSHLGDYCASKFAVMGMIRNIFLLYF